MMLPSRKWLIAALAVAGLQTAAIGHMVWDRVQLLRSGREIVLPIVPVDPRSLFRGDYVILSYEASRVPARLIPADVKSAAPQWFYVTFEQKGEAWQLAGVSGVAPSPTATTISIRARTLHGWHEIRVPQAAGAAAPIEGDLNIRYGIESYFVPEGKGPALEQTARDGKLAALIAVDARGNAAIKGLMIDGRRVYDEPLL